VQKLKGYREADGVNQPSQKIATDFISGLQLAQQERATARVVSAGDSLSFQPVGGNLLTNQWLLQHKFREQVRRPRHCPLMQFS
jgi:hypothetical protein